MNRITTILRNFLIGKPIKGEPVGSNPTCRTLMPCDCTMEEWASGAWIKHIGLKVAK